MEDNAAGDNAGTLSSLETRSYASMTSSRTSASMAVAAARAKAEAAQARASYAKKETEMMLEKANIEAKLNNLRHEMEVAAAIAEADALEAATQGAEKSEKHSVRIDTKERTRQYVEQQQKAASEIATANARQPDAIVHVMRSASPPRQRLTATTRETLLPKVETNETKPIPQPRLHKTPQSHSHQFQSPLRLVNYPTGSTIPAQPLDGSKDINDMARFLAKRDLLTSGLTQFDDTPENYWAWRSSFISAFEGLNLSPNEELDMLVKWLGPESAKHVRRLRAVHVGHPSHGLHDAWERLEECFGSPEIIEKSLFDKLTSFPKLNSKDPERLRELSDLLQEIDAAKEDGFLPGLSYLDTARGIAPIIDKLPHNIQEKWIGHGFKYKTQYRVAFPPFNVFCEFICNEARARNDPGFRLSSPTDQCKPGTAFKKPQRNLVIAHKTEIVQRNDESSSNRNDINKQCPLHKKPHPLKRCRGFRNKPISERKVILKENKVCFKCCASTTHIAKDCTEAVKCQECNSDLHVSALHPGPPLSPPFWHGGEEAEATEAPAVTSKCTEICGEGQSSRSCSKICLVNVFPKAHPERAKRAYVVLDDQSNRSLAKSEFFDMFNIEGADSPFTLRTCAGTTEMIGRRATGFTVESLDGATSLTLPTLIECNSIPSDRTEIPTPEVTKYHPHLRAITQSIPPLDPEANILILLGRDILRVHKVRQQYNGPQDAPYAQRLDLGWVIIGQVCLGKSHSNVNVHTYHTSILENKRPSVFGTCPSKVYVKDKQGRSCTASTLPVHQRSTCSDSGVGSTLFETSPDDNKIGFSIEDRLFLQIMDKEMYMDSANSWVGPLPFRTPRQRLPDNRDHASMRMASLQRTFERKPGMKQDFIAFMQKILDRDHAELAPALPEEKERWYLPSFGVYHPQKPGQIRVVFDSSAKYNGVSLNDVLLSGPDLNNSLIGVLMRFRRESIAVTVDIEQMFHSFVVHEDHRDFLRFIWHKDNNPANDLCDYRMKVHVFGNSPSPSVAMYGLHRAAAYGEKEYGSDARHFVERGFYVDDGLLSRPTANQVIDLLKRTQKMLAMSNLRLHKVASNSKEVMGAFPPDDRASALKELNLDADPMPVQRSLGLSWDLTKDSFTFHVAECTKPYTRRGVLSTINGLFDPMGFAAPVTIHGKMLLREISSEAPDWDSPLPAEREAEWDEWRSALHDLKQLQVRRPYATATVSTAVRRELHVFSDASLKAIAAVSFLRITDAEQNVHVGFVLGKAKLAPQAAHTIPRLELGAAVLAVEIADIVTSELDIDLDAVEFYTDSRVVLGYINNQTKRFYMYVCNRVQRIRRSSEPAQWHYVSTTCNPADIATRFMPASMLSESLWLKGPAFLSRPSGMPEPEVFDLVDPEKDAEVRAYATVLHADGSQLGSQRFERFSSWRTLLRAVSLLIHIVENFQGQDPNQSCRSWHYCSQPRSVKELEKAEIAIIKSVQQDAFKDELACIAQGKNIPSSSPLQKLSPYRDEEGVMRIGGRLEHAKLEYKEKHPSIIPTGHVANLLVGHHHQRVRHQGRVFTEGAVRTAGYWIMSARRVVKHIIHDCIACKKLRGRANEQRMADLPLDRLSTGPPFTFIGLDVFGPWPVMARRTRGGQANSKRWAVLFTCLSTRAVHIELIESMDTSSFINALRRFFSLRGPAKQIRSDCGTNFVGACGELGFLLTEPNISHIKRYLSEEGCSWIFNPPHSSHMGGSWERMIGISRRILDAMLQQSNHIRLTHEALSTFMAEVTAIINARPLSPITMDPDAPFLLTPAMLLTQKVYTPVPPAGQFTEKDVHRQQWRQVQHLADTFWSRWRREYLATLQTRSKWQVNRPNLKAGDLVLMKDSQVRRNEWPMGVINRTFPNEDGNIRKVEVKISRNGAIKTYLRPVTETVLLMSPED